MVSRKLLETLLPIVVAILMLRKITIKDVTVNNVAVKNVAAEFVEAEDDFMSGKNEIAKGWDEVWASMHCFAAISTKRLILTD